MSAVKRLWAVDILRGFAMFLVLVQHPYLLTDSHSIPSWLNFLVWNSTALAAVAFVVISGVVFSYSLLISHDWKITYRKYAVRALFLIVVSHPLITIARYPYSVTGAGGVMWSWPDFYQGLAGLGYITDTIALCILITPLFTVKCSRLIRLVLITLALSCSPFVVACIHPGYEWAIVVKEFLFGKWGEPKMFWYPLIPWLAIFLSGSFIGEKLAVLKRRK